MALAIVAQAFLLPVPLTLRKDRGWIMGVLATVSWLARLPAPTTRRAICQHREKLEKHRVNSLLLLALPLWFVQYLGACRCWAGGGIEPPPLRVLRITSIVLVLLFGVAR